MKHYRINNSGSSSEGFSLMEFVVYTALLAIVVMFLFQFLLGAVSSQNRGGNKEEVMSSAINSINSIDFEIRHAQRIYEATSDFASDPGQLSLLTRNSSYAGESETYVDIFVDSDQALCIKKENAGTRCITTPEKVVVTSLDFEKIDLEDGSNDGVLTTLTLEYNTTNADERIPYSVESFTQLRSY